MLLSMWFKIMSVVIAKNYKQLSLFGAEIYLDICPWTLCLTRSEKISKSIARGKL